MEAKKKRVNRKQSCGEGKEGFSKGCNSMNWWHHKAVQPPAAGPEGPNVGYALGGILALRATVRTGRPFPSARCSNFLNEILMGCGAAGSG